MKDTTVHSLVIARTLLERASPLCMSQDKYLASAGLVILQDALEGVFYALLIELGVDETRSLEKKSFDELIAELKTAGVSVPKSGTLKALNRQRVITKHYAQAAEPTTVRTYFEAAEMAIEETCRHVLKRSIRDLFIADILQKSDSKSHLQLAEAAISEMRYLDALIETRKAIFVEFEEDYNIYDWHDYDGITQEGLMSMLRRGGWRAPSWTKSQDWIEKNVRVPTDFIQIDYEKLRLQALEMGIHTVELQNLQSLTPKVFRIKKESGWSVTYAASFPSSNANETNARYCLDRAVWTILKKQEHAGARREPAKDVPFDPPPMYLHRVVFEKPSTKSKQIHAISEGFTYYSHRIVGGFDPSETFLEISAESNQQSDKTLLGGAESFYKGFLQKMPEDG